MHVDTTHTESAVCVCSTDIGERCSMRAFCIYVYINKHTHTHTPIYTDAHRYTRYAALTFVSEARCGACRASCCCCCCCSSCTRALHTPRHTPTHTDKHRYIHRYMHRNTRYVARTLASERRALCAPRRMLTYADVCSETYADVC